MQPNTQLSSPIEALLNIERIHIGQAFASKKRLLEFVADQLSGSSDAKQQKRVFQAIIEREKLGSTGIGNGIAIPHGRCPHIEQASLCVVTLSEGVDYDSVDKQSVSLAIGLITPAEANEEHLQILSSIAELLRNDSVTNLILKSKSAESIKQIILENST